MSRLVREMKSRLRGRWVVTMLASACGPALVAGNVYAAGVGNTTLARVDAEVPLYRSMSDRDVTLANRALDQALERVRSGQSLTWRNDGNGNSGSVRPLRTFQTGKTRYCREYEEVLFIDGRLERYVDIACRRSDGIWIPRGDG